MKPPTTTDTPETETPETEAHPSRWQHGLSAEFIHADFARNLERERNQLRRWTSVNGVDELRQERDKYRACHEGSKANAQELAKGYDALLRAVVKLRDCKASEQLDEMANLFTLIPAWVDTDWANRPRIDRVEKG